jgi:hypothetical protein
MTVESSAIPLEDIGVRCMLLARCTLWNPEPTCLENMIHTVPEVLAHPESCLFAFRCSYLRCIPLQMLMLLLALICKPNVFHF